MEEANAWRNPVDLVALLEDAFEQLPEALDGARRAAAGRAAPTLVETLLADEPAAIVEALLAALRDGRELRSSSRRRSAFAAAPRIARFPTSNEFGDWDTALHTFTFANAVQQGLRRSPSPELLRGVFDAAMSVYLDRFLNVPATRLPERGAGRATRRRCSDELPRAARPPAAGRRGRPAGRVATSARAATRTGCWPRSAPPAARGPRLPHDPVRRGRRPPARAPAGTAAPLPLIAAARYLAAHATTAAPQRQTYEIARRLHRGERIYEDEEGLPPAA